MTIRTRLLSLILALVMICSLLLVSCSCAPGDDAGKENGDSGGQVKPDGGDGGDGEEDGKDDEPDEPEVKEHISMGFLLKDISINLTEGTDMQLTIGEIYFEENAEGELLGEGYGTLIEKYNGTKRSENEIIIAVFKGYVYIVRWDSQAHGVASIGRIGQILKLADEKNIGRISLPAFLGMIDGAVGMNVSSLIMGAATSPDAMGNWLGNELIPALGSLNSSLLLGKLDQISTKLRESLIKTEGEGEGAVSVVDLGALAKWQSELSEKTVKEIIEQIFGEGSFLDMKTAVTGALTLSVSELISNLEANGANREKLFAALDSLAAIISGGEYKTLEELLKLSSDIEDMLDDPEVAGFTVSMLLMNILGIEGEVALSMKISEFYDTLSSKTLYEIIDTENSEIKSFIDSLTESLASYGDIRYKTDGDGKVTELYITADTKGDSATLISNIASLLNFSYKDGKISLDITADKGYYSEIKGNIELIYDKEETFGGEIFSAISEKLLEIPSEEVLLEKTVEALVKIYGEDVSFTYGEDGKPISAVAYRYRFSEVNSDFICEYTVEKMVCDLRSFAMTELEYSGNSDIQITASLVVDAEMSVYDVRVVSADGELIYRTDLIDPENPKMRADAVNSITPIYFLYDTVSGELEY